MTACRGELEGYGGAAYCLGVTDGSRSQKTRRKMLCTVAFIAAYTSALLPCGKSFVTPAQTMMPLPLSSVWDRAPVGVGGGGFRRAHRRRRSPVDALRMVRP